MGRDHADDAEARCDDPTAPARLEVLLAPALRRTFPLAAVEDERFGTVLEALARKGGPIPV